MDGGGGEGGGVADSNVNAADNVASDMNTTYQVPNDTPRQSTDSSRRLSSKNRASTAFGAEFDEKGRLPYQLNPVGHKEIKEEIIKNESMLRYLIRQFKVWFIGHIPIEVIRGLPKRCKCSSFRCISSVLFTLFFYVQMHTYLVHWPTACL